jgi:hypothetical protein
MLWISWKTGALHTPNSSEIQARCAFSAPVGGERSQFLAAGDDALGLPRIGRYLQETGWRSSWGTTLPAGRIYRIAIATKDIFHV